MLPLGDPVELDSSGRCEYDQMRAGPPRFQWRGSNILEENKIPWFNRSCYRVGQDLVCMLSEKFPEKVKVRQIDSQPKEQYLLEASFLREMGGHTLFQKGSRRKGFRGWPKLRARAESRVSGAQWRVFLDVFLLFHLFSPLFLMIEGDKGYVGSRPHPG
jgi:hypothetical protein